MKTILIIFAVGFITTQIPHTFQVFHKVSKIEGETRKKIQAWTFSVLTSGLIALFVYIGNMPLAVFGMLLEVVINLYYFTSSYWEDPYWSGDKRRSKPVFVWQYSFMQVLFSVLIPVMVLILSHLIHEQ